MMSQLRKYGFSFCLSVFYLSGFSQDPSFSQFFSSPLNINPAMSGIINSDWRAVSNLRSQWSGPTSPYQTATISCEGTILKDMVTENSWFAGGIMLMNDKAMDGALTGNYASLNTTFNLQIGESYNGTVHRLGAAIGGIYGHRRVDYTMLNFAEQFNGRFFDINLPTGQTTLSQMKPYFSTSAGIIYSQLSDFYNLDIGGAVFHANHPKQTFLQDKNQVLPVRYVAHANLEILLNDDVVINTNAIFQKQGSANYLSVGGAVGYYLSSTENIMLNAGMWYWSKNALVPYVGFVYKKLQIGISYDLTSSKLTTASRRPHTWELSLVFRGEKKSTKGIIYCPWK